MVHPGDTSPMSYKDSTSNKMERGKKRVEWSSNLSSVESFAPEDRSPNWDTETDHLLSYFLGGEQQNISLSTPPTQFATTPAPVNGNPASILHSRPTSSHPFASTGSSRLVQYGFPGSSRTYADSFDDDPAPPPTPATQYYHHSTSSSHSHGKSNSGRPPTHSSVPKMPISSTDSSIPSMKASLLGGHPYSSSDQTADSMSPISPAAMIGPGNEELMLPPPSPHSAPASASQSHASASVHQQRQSHLEWLQHINDLAKQAVAASSEKIASAALVHQSQQQHGMPSPAAIQYHGVTSLQVGVGAYAHAPMYYAQAALKQLQHQQSPPPESEEKRAKRLERNRESARKSRRRKKERLSLLEEKVNGLHNQIENARSLQIKNMNPRLQDYFFQRIVQLDTTENSAHGNLTAIFKGAGYNCEVQRAVIDFQYSKLKHTLLPRYHKFLLWLTLHPESWFSAAKEQHAKREASRQVVRTASGKISSKQVGDELTNGSKLEDGTFVPPPQAATANAAGEKANQTSLAFDSLRMWPLLCFELSISVDQEERILLAHKSAQKRHDLQHCRTQIEAATRMSSRLKEAVLLQSHNVAIRGERTYLTVLTPTQSVLYHQWLANNRERCRDKIECQKTTKRSAPTAQADMLVFENRTLIEVCRQLEAVLKISKGEINDTIMH